MRLRVASISLAEDMAWNWRCYTHILYTHVIYTHEVSSLRWEQALVWVSGRWLTDAHATSRSTPPQRHHWASATHPPLAHTSACANLTRSGVHCKVWASPRQRCSRGHAKHSLAPSAEGSEMGSALYRVLELGYDCLWRLFCALSQHTSPSARPLWPSHLSADWAWFSRHRLHEVGASAVEWWASCGNEKAGRG